MTLQVTSGGILLQIQPVPLTLVRCLIKEEKSLCKRILKDSDPGTQVVSLSMYMAPVIIRNNKVFDKDNL